MNLRDQEEENNKGIASNATSIHLSTLYKAISLKGDNQGSIAPAYNLVYHARTKHIDIQHHYICDKIAAGRINFLYIPTNKIIADGLTKTLTHAKFYTFVK